MDPQKLHLVVNHFPVVGSFWMLLLVALALWKPSKNLNHAALTLVVLVGMSALPAHRTGMPAEERLSGNPDVSISAVTQHERAASRSLFAALVTSALGFAGVAVNARKPGSRVSLWPALVGLAVTTVLMVQAAELGGKIRRPELRDAAHLRSRVPPISPESMLRFTHGSIHQSHHRISRQRRV